MTIAGQYVGSLENAGERIAIEGPLGEPIMEFTFDDPGIPRPMAPAPR